MWVHPRRNPEREAVKLAILLLCLAFMGCAQPEQVPVQVIDLQESFIIPAEAIVDILLMPDRPSRELNFWSNATYAPNHVLIDKHTWEKILDYLRQKGAAR